MISRVAEHCLWMARYLERAENTARILEVNHTLLLDFHLPLEQQWLPLLIISGIHDYKSEPTADNVQEHMTWDADNPFSIVSSLAWARENARIIREVISAEMWERMNYYHLWMQSPTARDLFNENRSEFYAQVRRINQLIHGISDATMAHGEAWEFFRLGAHLERASQTARIMDVKYHMLLPRVEDVGTPIDNAHWIAILTSCSGYEPFHKKPRIASVDPGIAVAEFLLFDELFPRSVRRCLAVCQAAIDAISETADQRPPNEAELKIAELVDWMNRMTILSVIRAGMHESLTHVVDSVHAIGQAIDRSFFEAAVHPTGVPSQKQSQG
jgi:uncharacterized alpha-E superfamily protein